MKFVNWILSNSSSAGVIFCSNPEALKTLNEVNELLPQLKELTLKATNQQILRMEDEAEGNTVRRIYEYRQQTQAAMLKRNDKRKGYIVWLDLNKRKV